MLHINELTFRIGGRVLFDRTTAHIPPGQRVGLVGRNGSGKSTLFRLILDEVGPDGGGIVVHPRARVGCVAQEVADGDDSLAERVLAADLERSALLAEEAGTTDGHRIADIHERLNAIGAHSAPSRAASILSGLGFSPEAQTRPIRDFSGGWRMRVALAAALFANPDLLLLDEPTNHLDLEATMWLESYLASYPGTLLVISHDRDLLNKVVGRILHLDATKLVSYTGGYDRFERTRREKIELLTKSTAKQLDQRKKIQAFVDRFRAKASKARQAQSRLKMLERMEPVIPIVEERGIAFDFPDPPPLSPPLMLVEDGVAGYNDKAVLRNLTLRIDMDDRIALLGANGNGKSTLAKILSGRMELMEGEVRKSGKLKVGYFAQHQMEELHADETPFQHMARVLPLALESKVRAHLGRFGFSQNQADVKVDNLSGGEKSRLLFALMSRETPHIMVLDEPTNHLDIDSRESLMAALNAYSGAVVLITHDPHLIEMVADRLWLVGDGVCEAYDGDLADYRRLLLDRARDTRRGAKGGNGEGGDKTNRRDARKANADARVRLAPLRKIAKDAEKHLESLTAKRVVIAAKIADPALYIGPAEKLTALQMALGDVDKGIIAAETAWMEANLALDEIPVD